MAQVGDHFSQPAIRAVEQLVRLSSVSIFGGRSGPNCTRSLRLTCPIEYLLGGQFRKGCARGRNITASTKSCMPSRKAVNGACLVHKDGNWEWHHDAYNASPTPLRRLAAPQISQCLWAGSAVSDLYRLLCWATEAKIKSTSDTSAPKRTDPLV